MTLTTGPLAPSLRFVSQPKGHHSPAMPSTTPGGDNETAAALGEIAARLSALTSEPPSSILGDELAAIRGDLKRLAAANEVVGRHLGESLGLQQPDTPQR